MDDDRRTYVALGDSSAEPETEATARPSWPDVLAAQLRGEEPELRYRNLAHAGATIADVHAGQLPAALAALGEDGGLVTVQCGLEDVRGPERPDRPALVDALVALYLPLVAAGATVLAVTYPNMAHHLHVPPSIKEPAVARVETLNAAVRLACARTRAHCADLGAHPDLPSTARALFGPDLVHPSDVGAALMALHVLDGVPSRTPQPA